MKRTKIAGIVPALLLVAAAIPSQAQEQSKGQRLALPYCVVDTGQKNIFDDRGQLLAAPKPGEPFFGQDGFYQSHPFSYTRSEDGLTVYDNNTGLTWQRGPDTNGKASLTRRDKLTWAQARRRPAVLNAAKLGGHSDWRLPSIKELYSLDQLSRHGPESELRRGYLRLDALHRREVSSVRLWPSQVSANASSTRSTLRAPCMSARHRIGAGNSSESTSPTAGSKATV